MRPVDHATHSDTHRGFVANADRHAGGDTRHDGHGDGAVSDAELHADITTAYSDTDTRSGDSHTGRYTHTGADLDADTARRRLQL